MLSALAAVQEVVDEWAGVELFHAELAKYLSLGGVIALVALCLAVFGVSSQRRQGVWVAAQILAFLIAALALWVGLWMGVHMGYGEWQGSSGAGDKAYADGAQLVGSLMFGWFPAGILAAVLWCLLTVGKWFFRRKPEPAA
ncbi:MAG: hypothetical protein MK291_13450 [Planctomycetes bacterium]|nr:hypothetical protein [Planctomycetota bacterium]